MATIRKRNDSYQITVSCGYDINHKQIRRTMTWTPDDNMTAKQIDKELQRQAVLFEEQCKKGEYNAAVKFHILAEEWLNQYAKRELKQSTYTRYQGLSQRVNEAIGHIRVDKLKKAQIQSFIDNLSENGINQRTGGGLAPKTVKHYLSYISCVLNYAVREGICSNNPCARVILPKCAAVERNCYTLDETRQFLELLNNEELKYQAFFNLAVFGGFRRGEILGLEWKDIDFKDNIVNIRRNSLYVSKAGGQYEDTLKTKSSQRSLKLPGVVFNILRKLKTQQANDKIMLGSKWDYNFPDRIFTTYDGKPMNSNTPYNFLVKFCKRTGMKQVNVHSFRHLNASLLINNGVDVRTVSSCLGHSQTSTTLNIYAHSFEEAKAKAMESVADVIMFKEA